MEFLVLIIYEALHSKTGQVCELLASFGLYACCQIRFTSPACSVVPT
jgi:hypothetical protein